MKHKNTYWLEKYRPKKLTDYYISKTQLNVVKEWIKDLIENNDDAKPFLILHGTPGIGKTTLAYLILEHYNYEIIECNASDTRTKKTIHDTLGQISKVSVCIDDNDKFKKTAIVMDEIDGLNGSSEFLDVRKTISASLGTTGSFDRLEGITLNATISPFASGSDVSQIQAQTGSYATGSDLHQFLAESASYLVNTDTGSLGLLTLGNNQSNKRTWKMS